MRKAVVDASVVAKWRFPEIHAEAALRLLEEDRELWSPDFIWAEIGSVTWKKWRRNEISEDAAAMILQSFQSFPLRIFSSRLLSNTAWEIARDFSRSFYDSLYVALAVQQECSMVTADRRLYNALGGASSRLPILWVEDIP